MDANRLKYYIESIQQSAYRQAGLSPPLAGRFAYQRIYWTALFTPFFFERGLANKLKAAAFALTVVVGYRARPPVTAHEIPHHYTTLRFFAERLGRAVAANAQKIATLYGSGDVTLEPLDMSKLVVATLPVASANAYVRQLDVDEQRRILLFVNVSIVPMISALARFASTATDTTERGSMLVSEFDLDKATRHVHEDTDHFSFLHDALRGILYGDMSLLWKLAPRPPLPVGRLYQMYSDAMATYVIGHEIGHLMLGHLSGSARKSMFHELNDFTVRESQELDADVFAFLLNAFVQEESAVNGGFERSRELFEAAAMVAFAGQDLLLRAYWMLEGISVNLCGEDARKSRIVGYPPYGDRLVLLKAYATRLVPDHAERLSYIADMHSRMLQTVGEWVFAYGREFEPDRQVAAGLKAAFGIGRSVPARGAS